MSKSKLVKEHCKKNNIPFQDLTMDTCLSDVPKEISIKEVMKSFNSKRYQICPNDDTQVEDLLKGKNKNGCGKSIAECTTAHQAKRIVKALNILNNLEKNFK